MSGSSSGRLSICQMSGTMVYAQIERFVSLSQQIVEAGSHLGWEDPNDVDVIRSYWHSQCNSIDAENHVLFCLMDETEIAATVQYERGHFPTSRHRAEVAKLMVEPRYRRRGCASMLMDHLELDAESRGIELLVLDTRAGEPVEALYSKRGYTRTGLIPGWAKYSTGAYRDTVFFYKQLEKS